jgi:Tol biopolymer transport system component
MAFSASRYASRVAHLWLRSQENGSETALFKSRDDATEPAFSPDGRTIAFRWEARGGGIFTIPYARPQRPRLLVAGASRPRYSPDGKQLAFQANGRALVMSLDRRDPRPLAPGLVSSKDPVWSPDGSRLLLHGCAPDACDWWIVDYAGGQAVSLGMAAISRKARFTGTPSPDWWLDGNTILFTATVASRTRLWTVRLSSDARSLTGAPKPLTKTSSDERWPALGPGGKIIFVSRTENIDVWIMPLDANRARPKGTLSRLTTHPAIDQRPSLSMDGRRIAWETSRGGNVEVRAKDLVSGREFEITNGPRQEHMPAISRDGSRIAYDTHEGDKVTVFDADFEGGRVSPVVAENSGQGSFQWSAKGDSLLYFHRAAPGTVGLLDLASRKRTVLLRHPKLNLSLADARLSPDDRWIAFPVPVEPNRSRLALAPLGAGVIDDETRWTWLTPAGSNAVQPEWSPDGRWLYFLSDRSGRNAVWALPVREGKAAGSARTILDFPHASLSIAAMRPRDTGLAVGAGKLAIGAAEYRGALWTVDSR